MVERVGGVWKRTICKARAEDFQDSGDVGGSISVFESLPESDSIRRVGVGYLGSRFDRKYP